MNENGGSKGGVDVPQYRKVGGRDLRAEGQVRLRRAMVNEKLANLHAEDAMRRMLAPAGTASQQAGQYLMDWAVTMLFYAALQYMDAVVRSVAIS